MNLFLVILLLLIGVVLLVIELFLIPGFGIAGIAGFLSLAGSVALAYITLTPLAGHITLFAGLILTAVAIYLFWRSRAIEKMALDTTINSSVGLANPGKKIEKLEKDALEIEKSENSSK